MYVTQTIIGGERCMKTIISKYMKVLLVTLMMIIPLGINNKIYADSVLDEITTTKTASELDDNYESTVEISFPGAHKNYASSVVFVLDKSGASAFQDIIDKTIDFLDDIRDQALSKNLDVKVGVVLFNYIGNVKLPLTDIKTGYDDIVTAIKSELAMGTNMHAGLLAGKKLLDDDTSVLDERKHLVLISDGATYLWCKDNDYTKAYTRTYGNPREQTNPETGNLFTNDKDREGGIWEYKARDTNFRLYDDNKSWEQIKRSDDLKTRLDEVKEANSNYTQYDYEYNLLSRMSPAYRTIMPLTRGSICNVEVAALYASDVFDEIEAKYNTYAFYKNVGDYDGEFLMKYLKRNSGGLSEDYAQLSKAILNIVDNGSYVEDVIAEEFDFINDINKISLSLGNTALDIKKLSENKYGFGDNGDGTYKFELEFTDDTNDKLMLNINTTVTTQAPLKLQYKMRLKNVPRTEGTYTYPTTDKSTLSVTNSENVYLGDINLPKPIVTLEIGKLVSKYIEETTLEELAPEEISYGRTGKAYNALRKTIPNHSISRVDGAENGVYSNGVIEVTFYYKKGSPSKPVYPSIPKTGIE